jgi:hypothetical protein
MTDRPAKTELHDTARETRRKTKPGLGAVVLSTLAAAIGVQSRQNQERDFQAGNIYHYVVAGVVFTVIFVATITVIVQTVLKNSGL